MPNWQRITLTNPAGGHSWRPLGKNGTTQFEIGLVRGEGDKVYLAVRAIDGDFVADIAI